MINDGNCISILAVGNVMHHIFKMNTFLHKPVCTMKVARHMYKYYVYSIVPSCILPAVPDSQRGRCKERPAYNAAGARRSWRSLEKKAVSN